MIDSPYLRGRTAYERVSEGRVDNTHEDAFTHTVRMTDTDRSLEVIVVAQPSPTYEIREAHGQALGGAVDASVLAGFARLAGVRMVQGFTRRVAEATGPGAGAGLVTDAAIEVARLARQVTKLPAEQAERAQSRDPWECWQLDTTGWVDLPGSCFTYSDAGRALFGTRPVSTPMPPSIYRPAPGQARVFARRKVARVERDGDTLRLFHSMHDDVHGFDLAYTIDAAAARIVRVEARTDRLPYQGICSEPQGRVQTLVGERVDEGLRKRVGTLVGGAQGCAQLYDLTLDLLKLLTY